MLIFGFSAGAFTVSSGTGAASVFGTAGADGSLRDAAGSSNLG